jgi:hypothetical protein
MKTHDDSGRRPHLVTTTPDPKDEAARQISDGVLKLQALWAEFDAEAFSSTPDHHKMATVLVEINTLQERLRAHGVRVRA